MPPPKFSLDPLTDLGLSLDLCLKLIVKFPRAIQPKGVADGVPLATVYPDVLLRLLVAKNVCTEAEADEELRLVLNDFLAKFKTKYPDQDFS